MLFKCPWLIHSLTSVAHYAISKPTYTQITETWVKIMYLDIQEMSNCYKRFYVLSQFLNSLHHRPVGNKEFMDQHWFTEHTSTGTIVKNLYRQENCEIKVETDKIKIVCRLLELNNRKHTVINSSVVNIRNLTSALVKGKFNNFIKATTKKLMFRI